MEPTGARLEAAGELLSPGEGGGQSLQLPMPPPSSLPPEHSGWKTTPRRGISHAEEGPHWTLRLGQELPLLSDSPKYRVKYMLVQCLLNDGIPSFSQSIFSVIFLYFNN